MRDVGKMKYNNILTKFSVMQGIFKGFSKKPEVHFDDPGC